MSFFDTWTPIGGDEARSPFRPLCPGSAARGAEATPWRPLFGGSSAGDMAGDSGPSSDAARRAAHTPDVGHPSEESAAAATSDAAAGIDSSTGADTGAFGAGYELGRNETRAELEVVAESFVRSLQELGAFRTRLRERYERELLSLALGVARKVVRAEVQARPEAWLTMIQDGIRRAVDREQIRIRVPAKLASFLTERLPDLRAQLDEVKSLELIEDASLADDGCIVETRLAELDLGLETQLTQVERGLTRAE